MKKLIFIILMLSCLSNVEAYCDVKTKSDLNKIGNNVNYTYDEIYVNDMYYFDVKLLNVNNNIYILDENRKMVYYYNGNSTIDLGQYISGSNIKLKIYSKNQSEGCNDLPITNIYISLPNYNVFSKDKLCKGIENYTLCQKWANVDMTYDQFKTRVYKYLESLKPVIDPIIDEETLLDKIFDFILEYHKVGLVIIIVLGTGGIIYLNLKKRVFKRYNI